MPAAVATGLPPKVEMVRPLKASATSARAIVTPIGMPLASPLALVMMSGVTPQCSMPNHFEPVRPQAVCTSSLMNSPPCRRTISATMGKYSGGGVMNPPTPWIGSAITAATLPEVEVLINSSKSVAQRTPQSG